MEIQNFVFSTFSLQNIFDTIVLQNSIMLRDPVSQAMFWHLEPMGTALVDPLPYTSFYPHRRTQFGSGFFVYPTIHFSLYEPFNEVFFILEYKTLWQCRNISHLLKLSLQNL